MSITVHLQLLSKRNSNAVNRILGFSVNFKQFLSSLYQFIFDKMQNIFSFLFFYSYLILQCLLGNWYFARVYFRNFKKTKWKKRALNFVKVSWQRFHFYKFYRRNASSKYSSIYQELVNQIKSNQSFACTKGFAEFSIIQILG